jgi:Na+-driven multidrug efflux pump
LVPHPFWFLTPFGSFPRIPQAIFTSDASVIAHLIELVPWLVTYTCLDALLAVGAGALTGSAQQGIGGKLALVSYVAIGFPAAHTVT